MVTINQVQRGMTMFLDRDIIPHLTGMERVVVGGGGALLASKLPAVMERLSKHPLLGALGVYNTNDGLVDIDSIYQAIAPYIGSESLALTIPWVNVTLKMSQREITALFNYIKEA